MATGEPGDLKGLVDVERGIILHLRGQVLKYDIPVCAESSAAQKMSYFKT
jgi:hypothetical protein